MFVNKVPLRIPGFPDILTMFSLIFNNAFGVFIGPKINKFVIIWHHTCPKSSKIPIIFDLEHILGYAQQNRKNVLVKKGPKMSYFGTFWNRGQKYTLKRYARPFQTCFYTKNTCFLHFWDLNWSLRQSFVLRTESLSKVSWYLEKKARFCQDLDNCELYLLPSWPKCLAYLKSALNSGIVAVVYTTEITFLSYLWP